MLTNILRLIAAFIDFHVIVFISTGLTSILLFIKPDDEILQITVYLFLCFTFLFLKDLVFKNASLGKKLLQLKVVNADQNIEKVKPWPLIMRNIIAIPIIPIEALLILLYGIRIGDLAAKTSVVMK